MKKFLVTISSFFLFIFAFGQINIIPKPVKLTEGTGTFAINKKTKIGLKSQDLKNEYAYLQGYLQKTYQLSVKEGKAASNVIWLENRGKKNAIKGRYQLEVKPTGVYIYGDDVEGVFYGIQSLIQLLPLQQAAELKVPVVAVEDEPRFAYRGMMLDCCRHFFSIDYVKQFIDYLALHKINTFHWHLTEDQGWRIEIKKYPLLTQVGACRNGTIIGNHPGKGNDGIKYCGYYTQNQIKEIVQYAAARRITVVPEIEMPGHSSAAIAAYPQLGCFPTEDTKPNKGVAWAGPTTGKQVQQAWGVYEDVYCPSEYTFNFIQDVLDEVMALFPSIYIHIGGDECPKQAWKRSPYCQQLIKEKGLKDEHGLQSYFIGRVEKYLNAKGRNIIGWDEILEGGLAPNATVMSWRGEQGGIDAARQGHNVIMTPGSHMYFDHAQKKNEDSINIGGFLPVDKVYSYNPVPAKLKEDEKKYILGAQANVWTEYIAFPSKVNYMIFPRMAALSEVLWTPLELKDWNSFNTRLQYQFRRYDFWNANYCPVAKE